MDTARSFELLVGNDAGGGGKPERRYASHRRNQTFQPPG